MEGSPTCVRFSTEASGGPAARRAVRMMAACGGSAPSSPVVYLAHATVLTTHAQERPHARLPVMYCPHCFHVRSGAVAGAGARSTAAHARGGAAGAGSPCAGSSWRDSPGTRSASVHTTIGSPRAARCAGAAVTAPRRHPSPTVHAARCPCEPHRDAANTACKHAFFIAHTSLNCSR